MLRIFLQKQSHYFSNDPRITQSSLNFVIESQLKRLYC